MAQQDYQARRGIGTLLVFAEHPQHVIATADEYAHIGHERVASSAAFGGELERALQLPPNRERFERFGNATLLRHHNAYVNTGLDNALDLEFGLGGTAIGHIGVSSDNTAVTAATVYLNGASAGTAANTIIKAISPAATRSAQTTTAGATFVNADFTGGLFIWYKIGLLNTATDAGTGLVDVIGGSGGSSPYNRTFTLDLTNAGTFSVTAQIAVTAIAV